LSIAPATATTPVGSTQTFVATGFDQYGGVFPTTVMWSVSGGGTINSSGVYSATAVGGPFTVAATSGTFSATATLTVVQGGAVNIAQGKSASASSVEVAQFGPALAVDGNVATRWSSAYSDPQWLAVDLGAVYVVSRVVLNWEWAYGRAYQIQVSTNGQSWT